MRKMLNYGHKRGTSAFFLLRIALIITAGLVLILYALMEFWFPMRP